MLQNQVFSRGRRWLRLTALLAGGTLLVLFFASFPPQELAAAALQVALEQPAPGKLAVVGAQAADLYDAPDGRVVQPNLAPGTTLTAVGRTADNQWILVYLDDKTPGWIEAQRLVVFGTEQLPVMAPESPMTGETPAAEPTQAATAAGATPTAAAATATPRPATATPRPTDTPLPSPTPSPTPSLTPSPTPLPTNTPTPALVAMAQSEVIAVVGADGADLVAAPGEQALQTMPVGAALTATGRSADGQWLYVITTDSTTGWVDASKVVAFNVRGLPVMGSEEVVAEEPAAGGAEANPTAVPSATDTSPLSPTVAPAATVAAAVTLTPTVESSAPQPTTAPTLRPTPVADGRPTARVAMQGSRLNVRAGPGTQYRIIGKALPNEVFTVLARNGQTTWVQIELPEAPDGFGWVSVDFVELSEPVVNLPISDETSSAPVPTPTPLPTTSTPANTAASSQPTVQQTALNGRPAGLSGKLVIQSQWGSTFYLYDLATGAVRALTGGMDSSISPDGTQIAFARAGGANGIYLINADGSNERRIFSERPGLRSPKWSPDGKWIVFSRADGEYKCRDLGFSGLCPSDSELLSSIPDDLPPDIKKEIGRKILAQFDQVSKPNWMIASVSATGDEYRDLPALNSALAPDWTDAGIVYQSTGGLQKTSDQPGVQTQKVYFDYNIADPDWQPGGGRIVFQMKQGPHWEIFAVNPDGSGVAALTRPATTLVDQLPSNVAPAWSPDGQHIVFLSNREPDGEAGQWRVWVMNADGGNQHPLPIDVPITYNYTMEQMVDWGR